jgi:flagella basal body P-ring formation protein FlgA
MTRITIITLALLTAFGGEAASQGTPSLAAPRLKELVTVTADLVRIGDLVDNAGAAASIAVFRAPDLGQTGAVQIARITEALKPHDVGGLDTGGLSEVVVTRLSRVISAKDVEERIARALAGQYGFGDVKNLAFTFDRELRSLHVEASVTADLLVARMNVEPRSGRFDVSFEIPGSAAARRLPLRFTGTVTETVEAATLIRAVGRGDMIRESDVVTERRPKAEAAGEAIGSDQAIGLSAKRPLRTGHVLRASDLVKADVVQRHEPVTIIYEAPGIMLTMRGKALQAGSVGDLISVLNIQSNRTVHGTVNAPGQVVIAATRPRVAAAMAPASDSNGRRRAQ